MFKKLFSLLVAFVIALSPALGNAKGSRSSSSKSSSKSYSTPSYKSSSHKIPSYNSKSSYKSYGTPSYKSNTYKIPSYTTKSSYKPLKSPALKTYNYKTPNTYKTRETKYDYNKTYKSSGLPKVERSSSARDQFLKSLGYKKVPDGYEVDHKIPLSKGGQDNPSNMQLLPKELHKQKTASER